MNQSWYVKHNGKTIGPLPPGRLKQLAANTKIKPETPLRLGDNGNWTVASQVKGLFPTTSPQRQQSPTPQAKSPAPQTDQAKSTSRAKDTGTLKPAPQAAANPYQSAAFLEHERPAPAADTRGLTMTRAGLYTVYYGICAVLFAVGVGSLLGILGTSMGIAVLLVLAGVLAVVAGLGGYLAILIGQLMCLTVPRESGGKGHVQIAVAIQASSILLAIGGRVITPMILASGSVDPALFLIGLNILSFVNSVMGLVGYVCFLYFIKNLALYIGRNDLASSSSTVMKLVIAVAVMLVVCPVMAVIAVSLIATPGIGPLVFGVLMLSMLITFLITFVRYGNLVGYLARAIPK